MMRVNKPSLPHFIGLRWWLPAGALISLVAMAILSLSLGAVALSWADIMHNPDALQVLLISRLPRTLAAIIAGAVLGVVGCLSQVVMNNHFAEPTTLGTPQGIVLGLLIASVLCPDITLLGQMLFGCVGGLLSLLFLNRLLAHLRIENPLQLPLIGLVYSAILGAAATFIAFEFDRLQTVMTWLNGDFASVLQGRYELLWAAALIVLLSMIGSRYLSLLGMGESLTTSLGVPYKRLIGVTMLMIALATSFVVVTVGMISFLGLIIPNIVRQYVGDNLTLSLPWCAWSGAFLLVLCDVVGRLLSAPLELPASLVFGTLAAPMFLVMLWRGVDHGH